MKCPVCWAEKAYYRQPSGWKDSLLRCSLMVPLKCHHCFHKFYVPWFLTWGKILTPPTTRKSSDPSRQVSLARKHVATGQRPTKVARRKNHHSCS